MPRFQVTTLQATQVDADTFDMAVKVVQANPGLGYVRWFEILSPLSGVKLTHTAVEARGQRAIDDADIAEKQHELANMTKSAALSVWVVTGPSHESPGVFVYESAAHEEMVARMEHYIEKHPPLEQDAATYEDFKLAIAQDEPLTAAQHFWTMYQRAVNVIVRPLQHHHEERADGK